jgi:hypothetical protein
MYGMALDLPLLQMMLQDLYNFDRIERLPQMSGHVGRQTLFDVLAKNMYPAPAIFPLATPAHAG